jgi:hypothetical protein
MQKTTAWAKDNEKQQLNMATRFFCPALHYCRRAQGQERQPPKALRFWALGATADGPLLLPRYVPKPYRPK